MHPPPRWQFHTMIPTDDPRLLLALLAVAVVWVLIIWWRRWT